MVTFSVLLWAIIQAMLGEVSKAFREGSRLVVGDGSQVKLLTDNWVRNQSRINTQNQYAQPFFDLTMRDLFCDDKKKWNL